MLLSSRSPCNVAWLDLSVEVLSAAQIKEATPHCYNGLVAVYVFWPDESVLFYGPRGHILLRCVQPLCLSEPDDLGVDQVPR